MNRSISLIDRILRGITTSGPSGHRSNVNEEVLHTPQQSRIRASPSNAVCGVMGGGLTPLLGGIQSVYSKLCRQGKLLFYK